MPSSSSPYNKGIFGQTTDGDGAKAYTQDGRSYKMPEGVVSQKWQGTEADRKVMSTLGRVQELRVREHGL